MMIRARRTATLMVTAILVSRHVSGQSLPMEKEPHHHLVFENSAFRIFEPRIEPGDITLDHEHVLDYVTVCISGAPTRSQVPGGDWGVAGAPCSSGSTWVSENVGRSMIHRVQNVGSGPFQLLLVENRQMSEWSDTPVLSAPLTSTIRESRAFRVYQTSLGSGKEGTRHVHTHPTVVVSVAGDIAVRSEDQTTVLGELGRWTLTQAGAAHTLSPGLSGKGIALEIEVR